MTRIQMSAGAFTRTYSGPERRSVQCPKCSAPVEMRILRTGMIEYICSCGKRGLVELVRMEAEVQ